MVCEVIKQLERALLDATGMKISDAFHDIPLKTYIRMREILAHKYWGVDMEIVWDTIKNDLPRLRLSLPALARVSQALYHQSAAPG